MISQNKQKGFTIVELLIVIVVIAILAAISIVAYNGVTQKSRDSQRASDARNIVNSLSSYNAENDRWISDANGATFKSTLESYKTSKVSPAALDRMTTEAPGSTGTAKDRYQVTGCGSAPYEGVRVAYYNEENKETKTLTAGTCSTTATP